MDPAALVEAVVEEVACPICMTFLREPVSIDCGHSFCQSCLSGLWEVPGESQNWSYTCPLCRAPVQPRNLRPNWQLASVVEKVRLLGLHAGMGLKGDMCELHREQPKIFCKEDGLIMCEACSRSPEHETHSIVPMEDVAWEYKWKLHEALDHLRKEQEEAWKLEVGERKRTANWKIQVETRRQSIMWEFEKYRQLLNQNQPPGRQLEVEAASALASLEQEEAETMYKLELNRSELIQQSQVLWKMIAELEERSQRPVRWMLQGIQDVLNRIKSWSLQRPELVSLELKTVCRVLGLRELLKTYAADVCLDPDTAYCRLIVSEDKKCVCYGDIKQNLPDNPERFYRYNIVLGSQCISSGRHYWEVEVGDRSEWGLGVCKENVDRKEVVYLSPHYGFWVIRLRKGNEYRAGTDEYPLLSLPVPPRRVGVFLDYEAHDISFYNVTDNGSHIFTFPRYPFPGRLLPYFSPCYSIGATNTAPLAICSLDEN
ncbi:E3 ubiquitin-protein ligase TRIM68 [Manis pentadactyla]|uniref:E3 ubiquitin-protein ligase TRIM68 n=1 Tax=Manis pentadactyla TaxID=143292 RepID=UPI0018761B58|nr:E3 ubiquitin-protein ligase TRIM68 [Manis pentadactyla]XP_036740794.1 E3 ubiquitin-protein ligase TRIM68 [Manis pentadactyla]XP_057363256.1 E3 ubiquitin-protein ligase TRIM68 [Manis pentadactyla]KAI5228244.1 E3 Ubiquitin-Protein Ligase Trim68 [Manis pentadactyla]